MPPPGDVLGSAGRTASLCVNGALNGPVRGSAARRVGASPGCRRKGRRDVVNADGSANQTASPPAWLFGVLAGGGMLLAKLFWDVINEGPDYSLEPREAEAPKTAKPAAARRPARSKEGAGFDRVGGLRELKTLLREEVVRPFRDPARFARWGLNPPNGVLLYGPPGCGKTLVGRALGEELGGTFQELVPSSVGSPFIHETSLRIRRAFEAAESRAPAVLFIDELEALVPARAALGAHQQYKSEEVNELLVRLDDCAKRGVLVVGATNEPWKIDRAILRTGRMDKVVYVGPPDAAARVAILRIHLAGRLCESPLDLDSVATGLDGYSGSDLRFLVDEAARAAEQRDLPISTAILLAARERVPASVGDVDDLRYRSFGQRGI